MGDATFVKSWPDKFRYAGGDVVLRFSHHPSGVLLLHSKILRDRSSVFEAMFSKSWKQSLITTSGNGAQSMTYFEVDLLLDCEEGFTYLRNNASCYGKFLKSSANLH
jgi:hypothetical protein